MALSYAKTLFSASQCLRVYYSHIFPPLICLISELLPYYTRSNLRHIAILSYSSAAPSQPTNSVLRSLNGNIMSRELDNDLRCLKFTLRLPLVERDETLPNGAECVICKEPYGENFQIRGPELGCQLPCNCIIGHLCAWNHFAPSKGAHVTCPVCYMRFSELNKIDEGVFSPPTNSSRQKHEVEVEKQLEQLAYAT